MPMNNELITKNNEWVVHFMKSLERMTEGIEQLAASCRPLLSGEHYLTGLPDRRSPSLYPVGW